MAGDFAFADWNPKSGTVPAYYQDPGTGLIVRGAVVIGQNGEPCDRGGFALAPDGATVTLRGWSHTTCASYNGGRVLVPLKGSRTN